MYATVVSEGRMHPNPNVSSPANSQLRAGHEPGRGRVDPVDDNRVRGAAGADRGDGLLPAYAPAGGAARAARLGGGPDAAVGGRDDRGRLDHAAGRLALRRFQRNTRSEWV